MNAIYGLFADSSSAQRAVLALRGASARLRFRADGIVVLSSEPIEEGNMGWERERTAMPWIAALGGVLGGISGYALASFTQRTYPLPTGGMPIVALWPTGIVVYELTMLSVILTTLVTFLVAARLPRYRRRLYDPEISNGKILVGVTDSDSTTWSELEQTLYHQGAERVKQWPAT
ncbi:MAG TPA: quinol:electron acceptor oxidoreductase subunit ActD [Candidatus Acidoferrales bacterium]|nr:quinol:electron acceptor oxidoreductase subunit ActD [Candidatus Acidoferrales bacterium]